MLLGFACEFSPCELLLQCASDLDQRRLKRVIPRKNVHFWASQRCSPKFWEPNPQKLKFWAHEQDFQARSTTNSNTLPVLPRPAAAG